MKIIVNGLGFGDECKGSMVDFLSHALNINTVVRYNGGCQAAHNVDVGPIHHTFAQFGSATLNNGQTILSKFMLVDPIRLLSEADVLISKGITDALNRLTISENCIIITPLHRLVGQLKELSRSQRHGSCGYGVGEAVADGKHRLSLRMKDLLDRERTKYILEGMFAEKIDLAEQLVGINPDNQEMAEMLKTFLQKNSVENITAAYHDFAQEFLGQIVSDEVISDLLRKNQIIFEGAQGTLLDQTHGFFPYVTRSNCTIENAKNMIDGQFHSIGLVRAYFTRHGNGPFPTESELNLTDKDNYFGPWQGNFRSGWLDLVLLRYAIAVNNGINSMGLTCVDKLINQNQIKVCTHYYYSGNNLDLAHDCFEFDPKNPRNLLNLKMSHLKSKILTVLSECTPIYQNFSAWRKFLDPDTPDDLPMELKKYINFIEEQTSVPISLISYGPDRQQKLFLKKIVDRDTPSFD